MNNKITETQLAEAVNDSTSIKEVLIKLERRSDGGSGQYLLLHKLLNQWNISISHFLTQSERLKNTPLKSKLPLNSILVINGTYNRHALKNRLYSEGVKNRLCEFCGQSEMWHGRNMSLILDHINGIYNDNRLENLRILCPNCNATLPTHCGKNRNPNTTKQNKYCQNTNCKKFLKSRTRKFCSKKCFLNSDVHHTARVYLRKVVRPPYEQLKQEIEQTNKSAVARKYKVNETTIRNWCKFYEKYK